MSSNECGEGEIRKALVEANLVDCTMALPGQLFYSTPIPACLRFLARSGERPRGPHGRGQPRLHASWQRCRVHFPRNVLAQADKVIGDPLPRPMRTCPQATAIRRRPAPPPGAPDLPPLMDGTEADDLAFMPLQAHTVARSVPPVRGPGKGGGQAGIGAHGARARRA